MPLALQPTSFVPVVVTLDWSDAENAETDVATSLAVFGITIPMSDTITCSIVEGSLDPDDKAILSVNSAGTASWSNAFATVPSVGATVYIIDMY